MTTAPERAIPGGRPPTAVAGLTTVDGLRELLRAQGHTPARKVPVHPRLREAFPSGLRPGGVYSLLGSRTVALALLAAPSQQGSWCACVGLPDVGIEAAADWGLDLDRFILIPHPPVTEWLTCVAELIEVADVVLACPPPRLLPGEVSKLTGRLRHRGGIILITGAWQRPTATVRASTVGWEGVGDGHGHLVRQRLQLEIDEQHRRRTVEVVVEAA